MTGFWIVAAVLTAAACAAVLLPFIRARKPPAGGSDIEVYRDQMAEVDRDFERGAINAAEAEEAKAEIGRRALRAADADAASARTARTRAARTLASLSVFAVPVLALGLYWSLGSPGLPDQALQARLAANPTENSIDELIARAERHLVENPDDPRGWDVLAPIYLRVGRVEDAVLAYRNAIRLNGPSAERDAGLGDALYRIAGGIVTAEAQAVFERALAEAPDDPKANFFIALGMAQQGDAAAAVERWQAMIADLAGDSPWRGAAEQALARTQESMGEPAEGNGPTAEDMQAAAEMSAEDRNAMIEGMVASLDQRLRDNPNDADGWRRLIRSYAVLGRQDEARDALRRGLEGVGLSTDDGRALMRFAAEELGIEPAGNP
ncbi:MAG: c-type cytochrome biogenesis protein CcmI [Rhizobiaceae bacterium]|nr:c-type cytochrome biogenesis protein CcmI [Rhizobiaceae bacterium]